MATDEIEVKGNVWALILPVLLVVIGHIIGEMISDNFYWKGFIPTRKTQATAIQTI